MARSGSSKPARKAVTNEGQRIAELLREAIRSGLLPPGTPLAQRNLARSLEVSRIPVRDALQILSAEGLVTAIDGRTRVTALAVEEIDELYSLRLLIEPALAEAIISNHAPADLRGLKELVHRMDEQEAEDSKEAWANTNFDFHDALYAAAGRPLFHRIARQLLTLVESYSRTAVFQLGGWRESQREHQLMLKAIAAGDASELRNLLQVHLERARSDLLEFTSQLAARELDEEAGRTTAEAERIAVLILEDD